jgi:hypothetical protein
MIIRLSMRVTFYNQEDWYRAADRYIEWKHKRTWRVLWLLCVPLLAWVIKDERVE